MITYILIAICVIAAIGLIVGFFLGYTRQSSWGGCVLGAALVCFVVDRAGFAEQWVGENTGYTGLVRLGTALLSLIILTLLFALVKRFLNDRIAARRKLAFYRSYDEREDNVTRTLIALDKKDKKAYRRYSKKKFSAGGGAWGAVNRIFGAITLALNIFVALSIIGGLALIILDSCHVDSVMGSIPADSDLWLAWKGELSAILLDVIVITLMCMCLHSGYRGGVLSVLSTILCLGVLVGAGWLAYYVGFGTDAFLSAGNSVYATFEGALSRFVGMAEWLTEEFFARLFVTVIAFLILLIPAIIICIFLPKAIDKLRSFETLSVIDGVLGAVLSVAVVSAVLLIFGTYFYQLCTLEGFEEGCAVINDYMMRSHVAKGLYSENILNFLYASGADGTEYRIFGIEVISDWLNGLLDSAQ